MKTKSKNPVKISRIRVKEISNETKQYCSKSGAGAMVNIFPDGSTVVTHCDLFERGIGGGKWEKRIGAFIMPFSTRDIAEYLIHKGFDVTLESSDFEN